MKIVDAKLHFRVSQSVKVIKSMTLAHLKIPEELLRTDFIFRLYQISLVFILWIFFTPCSDAALVRLIPHIIMP